MNLLTYRQYPDAFCFAKFSEALMQGTVYYEFLLCPRDTCVTSFLMAAWLSIVQGRRPLAWPAPAARHQLFPKLCYLNTAVSEQELLKIIPCPPFGSFLRSLPGLDSKLSNDTRNPLSIMEVRAPDPFGTILGLIVNENKETGIIPHCLERVILDLLVMVPKYNVAPWFLHCRWWCTIKPHNV